MKYITKRKRSRSNANKRIVFKISVLLLCFYLVYSFINLQSELVQERAVLRAKQSEITELEVSNKELENLLKNGDHEELIERAARDKLDFVYANEEIYQDVKGN